MPLSNFVRRKDYFSSFTTVKAESIDREFNKLAEYLNQGIIASLNNIINSTLPGSLNINDMNKFFQTSNGEFKWTKITNDAIKINSIPPVKLAKYNPGSILVAGVGGGFAAIAPTAANQVLTSSGSWRVLNSNDIVNNSITGQQLGALNRNCFADNVTSTGVMENSISTENIQNYCITSKKIADGTITGNHFGLFSNFEGLNKILHHFNIMSESIADGAITGDKIAHGSIAVGSFPNQDKPSDFRSSFFFVPSWYYPSIIWGNAMIYDNDLKLYCIKVLDKEHIKNESITDDSLMAFNPVNRKYEGCIVPSCLSSGFKLPAAKIAKGLLKKEDFDDEVQKALAKFGI